MDEVRLKGNGICASFEEIEDKSIRKTIYDVYNNYQLPPSGTNKPKKIGLTHVGLHLNGQLVGPLKHEPLLHQVIMQRRRDNDHLCLVRGKMIRCRTNAHVDSLVMTCMGMISECIIIGFTFQWRHCCSPAGHQRESRLLGRPGRMAMSGHGTYTTHFIVQTSQGVCNYECYVALVVLVCVCV